MAAGSLCRCNWQEFSSLFDVGEHTAKQQSDFFFFFFSQSLCRPHICNGFKTLPVGLFLEHKNKLSYPGA